MNANNSSQSAEFISTMKVVQRSAERRRPQQRCSRIIHSNRVCMENTPIIVGKAKESIVIVPIMENGRIKALKASCSCGSESIYDIQYTETEEKTL